MKKTFLTLSLSIALITVSITVSAQNKGKSQTNKSSVVKTETLAAKAKQAIITFEKEVHDYGTIKQGSDGTCQFKFTNTGNEPLIISNAAGSCGCTVPSWPKEPIKPGESATIDVKYDTNRIGMINKTITITSNATEPTKILRIKGNVEALTQEKTE